MVHSREKIMTANADGNLLFFDKADFKAYLSRLMQEKDVETRSKTLMNLAQLCEEHQFTYRAYELYRAVLVYGGISEYKANPHSEVARMALKAYRALLALPLNQDECLWEDCSQLIGDVRDVFEKGAE